MRFTISICLIATCGLLDSGCVDSRPIHYYTIATPSAPVTRNAHGGPIVLVGNISTPPELADGRIHYRVGANEVGAYQFHRWIERPEVMVRTSLAQALRTSGKYRAVLESTSSTTGDYVLRGRLFEFDEVDRDTIQTMISLRVDLEDLKTRRIVWDDVFQRDEPVSNRNVSEVVQSLDRNLRAVANETAAGIDKFLAGLH